jgi:hypothetical protein
LNLRYFFHSLLSTFVFVRVIKVVLCQFMESIEFFDVWVLRKGLQDGDWVEINF